jgi:hypothetical protein
MEYNITVSDNKKYHQTRQAKPANQQEVEEEK